MQARTPRTACKVVSPAGALTRFFGAISWSRLAAACPVGHIGSCSPFCLYNSFSLLTSVSFSLLWLFYTMLFLMVFCYWYAGPGLWLSKGTAKARDIAWEFFEHTPLWPDELSVNLSLQLFCYCNFSSLPLPPMLLLSYGSALMVTTFNCA